MPRRDFSRVVSYSRAEFERRREALRAWRAGKFGTGAQSQLMFGDPWASAYRIGPHPELIGRDVRTAAAAASSPVHGELANAGLLADVESSKQILPTRVTGRLEGGSPGALRQLAVAVNGRIRAVGRSFHLRGRRAEYFSLMVPETALRRGPQQGGAVRGRGPTGGWRPSRARACSAAGWGRGSAWCPCPWHRGRSTSSGRGRRAGCSCGSSRRRGAPCRKPRGCGAARRRRGR